MLRHIAEPRTYLDRLVGTLAQHLGGAGGRPDQPQEELDGRALASPVRPQQAGHTFANLEVHPVQRDDGAVVLRERLRFQQRHAASITSAGYWCPEAVIEVAGPPFDHDTVSVILWHRYEKHHCKRGRRDIQARARHRSTTGYLCQRSCTRVPGRPEHGRGAARRGLVRGLEDGGLLGGRGRRATHKEPHL